ncbi:MAG: hypothetical protein ACK47B_13915 [Armatimonadota bacterium]
MALGFQAREGEAAFEKPHRTPCPHLVKIGCGIYPERPPVCRRFQCGWLQAPNLPEGLRPDRCGVLFSLNDSPHGEGQVVYAHELRPGAADRGLAAWLIQELSSETTVLLVRDGRCEVLTPDPELQERLEAEGGISRLD